MLIRGNHETFNRSTRNEGIHNLRDVRDRDAAIKKMIRFDYNRYTGVALIETARCADARFELSESTRGNFSFQRSIHFF